MGTETNPIDVFLIAAGIGVALKFLGLFIELFDGYVPPEFDD